MSFDATFSFGKNWENFFKYNFSEERVAVAQKHLLDFLSLTDLRDKTFLDIGCGSGLHSLAAFKAGAKKIISFDFDPYSVRTTNRIREMYGNPPNWEVLHGSVLDTEFISSLPPADIVYSWGVLHHTGHLWQAVKNAATRLKPGSFFYIAIYEKNQHSGFWIKVKKTYNRSPWLLKKIMELLYAYNFFFRTLSPSKIKSSLAYMRNYQKSRGMEYWTDVKDWLGGWPYEPATLQEVCSFCEEELGLESIQIKTGAENIEYLYRRKS